MTSAGCRKTLFLEWNVISGSLDLSNGVRVLVECSMKDQQNESAKVYPLLQVLRLRASKLP